MKVLLDTHTLLWATLHPGALSKKAAALILDETIDIMVSAASAWEIATKVRLGRLPEAEALALHFMEDIDDAGYSLRAISVEDGLRAGRLVRDHQDPFDRMLVAQALNDSVPLISADEKLDGFGVQRIW